VYPIISSSFVFMYVIKFARFLGSLLLIINSNVSFTQRLSVDPLSWIIKMTSTSLFAHVESNFFYAMLVK